MLAWELVHARSAWLSVGRRLILRRGASSTTRGALLCRSAIFAWESRIVHLEVFRQLLEHGLSSATNLLPVTRLSEVIHAQERTKCAQLGCRL